MHAGKQRVGFAEGSLALLPVGSLFCTPEDGLKRCCTIKLLEGCAKPFGIGRLTLFEQEA
jgi:hypothetical protein